MMQLFASWVLATVLSLNGVSAKPKNCRAVTSRSSSAPWETWAPTSTTSVSSLSIYRTTSVGSSSSSSSTFLTSDATTTTGATTDEPISTSISSSISSTTEPTSVSTTSTQTTSDSTTIIRTTSSSTTTVETMTEPTTTPGVTSVSTATDSTTSITTTAEPTTATYLLQAANIENRNLDNDPGFQQFAGKYAKNIYYGGSTEEDDLHFAANTPFDADFYTLTPQGVLAGPGGKIANTDINYKSDYVFWNDERFLDDQYPALSCSVNPSGVTGGILSCTLGVMTQFSLCYSYRSYEYYHFLTKDPVGQGDDCRGVQIIALPISSFGLPLPSSSTTSDLPTSTTDEPTSSTTSDVTTTTTTSEEPLPT